MYYVFDHQIRFRQNLSKMESITLANINTQQHQIILTNYITSKAIYQATKYTLDKANLFKQVFSTGNCDGLKSIDMDIQTFKDAKKVITQEVKDDLTRISNLANKCLPSYHKYLTVISLKISNIKKELDIVRKGVLQHNHNQSEWANLLGKLYSNAKLTTDVSISVLLSRIGSAGMAVTYMYGMASKLANSLSDAETAEIWSFSGSSSRSHLKLWKHLEMIKQPTLGVKIIGAGINVFPYVIITNEFLDNLGKFE